jgi:hypothetical protein
MAQNEGEAEFRLTEREKLILSYMLESLKEVETEQQESLEEKFNTLSRMLEGRVENLTTVASKEITDVSTQLVDKLTKKYLVIASAIASVGFTVLTTVFLGFWQAGMTFIIDKAVEAKVSIELQSVQNDKAVRNDELYERPSISIHNHHSPACCQQEPNQSSQAKSLVSESQEK